MKSSRIVSAIAAVALGLGSVWALAQGQTYDRNASNNPEIYQRTHPNGVQDRNLQGRPNDRDNRRGFDQRDDNSRAPGPFYYGARSPEFRRGGYIPYEYRSRQYFVNDWRGHQLSAPPRGYQWVQVGSDYVLIALATGLIANLILSR